MTKEDLDAEFEAMALAMLSINREVMVQIASLVTCQRPAVAMWAVLEALAAWCDWKLARIRRVEHDEQRNRLQRECGEALFRAMLVDSELPPTPDTN